MHAKIEIKRANIWAFNQKFQKIVAVSATSTSMTKTYKKTYIFPAADNIFLF